MKILKVVRDYLVKGLSGKEFVPRGLAEFYDYFRHNKAINFSFEKKSDIIIARSIDFRFGAIVTSGRTMEEVDRNIKDAILTSFEIPSSYAKEAKIVRAREREYAPA